MKSVLSPRQLAQAIGVSESSVKRWVDDGHIAGERTVGGHRRIAIHEAVRYIRDSGATLVRPELLGLEGLESTQLAGELEEEGQPLLLYLEAGAAVEVRSWIVSRYLAGSSVADIVDGPLAAAMSRLGELWKEHRSGVFLEHRATEIVKQGLDRLRLVLAPSEAAHAAVGGAPSGDRYLLPSLAVATVLEGEGIRATNLGAETPLDTLAIACRETDARLAWLSISVIADARKLTRDVEELVDQLDDQGVLLVVGGRQSSKLSLPQRDSVYLGRSMGELVALVRGMRLAPRRATDGG